LLRYLLYDSKHLRFYCEPETEGIFFTHFKTHVMFRKIAYFLIATVAIVNVAHAQQTDNRRDYQDNENPPKDILLPVRTTGSELGFHIGPGFSILYNQQPRLNPRTPNKPVSNAFAAGLTYQYNFTRMISLHAEANYERKGDILYNSSHLTTTDAGTMWTHSYAYDRINYITLPVMARFTFGKVIRFFTDAGLYAGFRFSSYRITNNDMVINSGDVTTSSNKIVSDITGSTRTVDGGLVTGLGIGFPLGRSLAFSFEVRNNLGFAKLGTNADVFPNNVYNNSTNFLFGLSVNMNNIVKPVTKPLHTSSPE
jgi:hypothetical protein